MTGVFYRTDRETGVELPNPVLKITGTIGARVWAGTEQAKEAAFLNDEIKPGTIVHTYVPGQQGSYATVLYMRNQSVLSDWEAVTASTSGTAVQYDGCLSWTADGQTITVNGNTVSSGAVSGSIIVAKGDVVAYTGSNAPTIKGRFYKLRDYTGR